MDKLIDCILRVFPGVEPDTLTSEAPLGQLPDWDSMNSVNLTMEFEAEFGLKLFDNQIVFVGSQPIGEVRTILRDQGAEV